MELSANLLTYTLLIYLPSILHAIGKIPDAEEMEKEIYCVGCEYTVKALFKLIHRREKPEDGLDLRVAESLQNVCSKDNFNGAEIPSKYLIKACEFLIEENESVLEPLLVTHFSQSSHATYMDLSQQVCNDLSNSCVGVPGEKRYPDHLDSDLEFDSDSQTFRVKQGRNIRYPEPVRANKDDL